MTKTTVEECWVVDVVQLAREGDVRHGQSGTLPCTRDGETVRIGWEVEENAYHEVFVRLGFLYRRPEGREINGSHGLLLERSLAGRGQGRVWFLCPDCQKRARKLYLPPTGGRFACRTCHRLSYRSRQHRLDPWERVAKLERQLLGLPPGSKRWQGKVSQIEGLEETMPRAQWEMPSHEELLRPYPSYEELARPYPFEELACPQPFEELIRYLAPPPRRPGRPSKREARSGPRLSRKRPRPPWSNDLRVGPK